MYNDIILLKSQHAILDIFPPQEKSMDHKYVLLLIINHSTITLRKIGQKHVIVYPDQKHIYVNQVPTDLGTYRLQLPNNFLHCCV